MTQKSDRVYIRLEPHAKRYLEQAAAMNNRSLSSFIITGAMSFADELIEQGTGETLSEQEYNALHLAMMKPPASFDVFQRAFKHYS